MLSSKLFVSPAPKMLLMLVMMALAWIINFGVKKKLMPYPGIFEHFINFWFSGIDSYDPDVDEKPVPLVITREMEVGHAVVKAAAQIKTRPMRQKRSRHVRKEEKTPAQ